MADGGAGAGRCLSDLPDDLLRHILFFAPDKEGASTAVLSRRWRWLWRTSGAVFLHSRSFSGGSSSPDQDHEGILRSAKKALCGAAAAAHDPIRRLTLFIATDTMKNHVEYSSEHNLVEALVSNTAAQCVEELKIVPGQFRISFGCLPSEALRVLRLIRCSTLTAPLPGMALPMLVELHLQDCDVSLIDFQKIVNSAPRLSTLHLISSTLYVEKDDDSDSDYDYDDDSDDSDEEPLNSDEQPYSIDDDGNLFGQLLIPAVTALVVADCEYGYKASLELDVPRLQCFTYRGHAQTTNLLTLKSQTSSNMIQVDLDLTSNRRGYIKDDSTPTRNLFWQFVQNFNSTRLLKLKLDFTTDHLVIEDKVSEDELIGGLSFYLLEQVEVEAEYHPEFERPLIVMLGNLLHSCPVVVDLRLKLRKRDGRFCPESFIEKEAGVHFDRSVSGFRNRRKPMVSLGAQDDDNYYQANIVPGFTGEHLFSFLQYHLRRVSLQFFMDEPNCLGVQLAKFFAEYAMVLDEILIDDGCQEMLEHVNPTINRCIAKTDMDSKQLNAKD